MYLYLVGQPHSPGHTNWPEGSEYSYRRGAHHLRLFFRNPSPHEIEAVQEGKAQFAFTVHRSAILLLFRFGDEDIWGDAPYSWHLVPAAERTLPHPPHSPEERALVHVLLVDAHSGIIRAQRYLTFSPDFTALLHDAITKQAVSPWPGRLTHDHDVDDVFHRYPRSKDLLRVAVARTRGGE